MIPTDERRRKKGWSDKGDKTTRCSLLPSFPCLLQLLRDLFSLPHSEESTKVQPLESSIPAILPHLISSFTSNLALKRMDNHSTTASPVKYAIVGVVAGIGILLLGFAIWWIRRNSLMGYPHCELEIFSRLCLLESRLRYLSLSRRSDISNED